MTNDTAIVGPSRAVKLCGTEATDPPRRRLAAGRLTAELENGQLRYVSFGGIETLRGIAFLVRDENWGTYAPQIDGLEVKESAESFAVSYRAVCADPRQRLVYEARISGSSDGSLAFDAVATPETDFVTNRAGFVVLHPGRARRAKAQSLPRRRPRVRKLDSPERSARPSRSSTSERSRTKSLQGSGRPVAWRATRSKWRISGTGPTRRTRPMCDRWRCLGATRSPRAAGMNSPCSCRLPDAWRAAARRRGSDVTIKLGGNLATNMPDLGVALPAEEAAAALAASDALRTLNPHFLVCNVDARDGRGLAELEAYRQVAEAVSAGRRPRNRHPRRAGRRRFAGAGRRSRSSRALEPRVGRRLERGRFEILAARRKAPRETDGRRDLRSCARCFSRRKAWRRHALHLHRTQSEAAEGRAFRLCDPYDMLDRSCCRRSLCDGDARNAAGHHRLDQGDDWR